MRGGFSRGGRGGSGSRGSFRGGRGGASRGPASYGPPDQVFEMGKFLHPCEGELVCESTNPKIPYFNAPIYLASKLQVGKVDEILGSLSKVLFTVKLQQGVVASSFKANDKVFIASDKLLPIERFLPKPKSTIKPEAPLGRQGMVQKRGGRGSSRGASPRGGFRGRGGTSVRGSFRGSSSAGSAGRGMRGGSRGRY